MKATNRNNKRNISRRSFFSAAAIGVLSSFMLPGCHSAGDTYIGGTVGHAGENPEQVIISLQQEPKRGFNPVENWGWSPSPHDPLIQSTLVKFDPNTGFFGDLAQSFHCSEDGLTWYFELRDDASFTNGRPVCSDDVVFTVDAIRNNSESLANFSFVKSVNADGKNLVSFQLHRPSYSILSVLSTVGIVPAAEYSDSYGLSPIGSGMYKLVQWEPKLRAILEYNDHYYGAKPFIKRIVVAFQDSHHTFSHALTGDLDLAYLPIEATVPSVVYGDPWLEYMPTGNELRRYTPDGYSLLQQKATDVIGIRFPPIVQNDKNLPNAITDPVIREAIWYGVNRQELINRILFGYGEPASSPCDYQKWSIKLDYEDIYDWKKATKLLDEGGWALDKLTGIRKKQGRQASLIISHRTDDPLSSRMAILFKEQMLRLGIDATLLHAKDDLADMHPCPSSASVERHGSPYPWELLELYSTIDNVELETSTRKAYAAHTYADMEEWVRRFQEVLADEHDLSYLWLVNVHQAFYTRSSLHSFENQLAPKQGGWGTLDSVSTWRWQ